MQAHCCARSAPGSTTARMQPFTRPAAQHPMRAGFRTEAAKTNTEAALAAAAPAAVLVPVATDSTLPPKEIQQVCQLLESSLQQPAAAIVKQVAPRHQWGQGLSTKGFAAALQALPMQQKLRWKSLYPAIGTGSRGKVYQAVNLDTGGVLAVKVVSLKHLVGDSYEAGLRREALVLELAAMQDYTHPNLLAMKGFHFHGSKKNPSLEIYSELGCCLEDLLPDEDAPSLGLGLVQKIMTALVTALEHLHNRGVVHRDVKPGNIVSFGSSGTFKLIDMDSIYYTHDWEEDEEDEQPTKGRPQPEQQQQQQPQQRRRRRPLGVMRGDPCPASLSAHLAGNAAALQLQQQTPASDAPGSSTPAPQQQQQKQLNALSFAGTPENMAPEVAPRVLQLAVVLFDLFPLKEGQQVASSTAVAPAQDIWSTGTVLYELITGRSLFSDIESPEELYQHFGKLRGSGASMPAMPQDLDTAVLEVLQACLQLDPAARPTAKQLLTMPFFSKQY